MADYADLEIGIHRWDDQYYAIDLRFLGPDDDTVVRLLQQGPSLLTFDFDAFTGLADDVPEYGRALSRTVFADEMLRTAFTMARSRAGEALLRLRLFIGPSAPELHALHWEKLIDPQDPGLSPARGAAPAVAEAPPAGPPAFLATNERIPFSRYLTSVNFWPIRLKAPGALNVLAVVASPSDVANWKPEGRALAPGRYADGPHLRRSPPPGRMDRAWPSDEADYRQTYAKNSSLGRYQNEHAIARSK